MNTNPQEAPQDDIPAEYNLTGKSYVRGKYYQRLRDGYSIQVQQADGTIVRQTVVRPEGTILLDPDVRAYFPDAEAVNTALRALIDLIPVKKVAQTSE